VAGRLSAGENNCSSGRIHYTSGGRPRSVTAVFAPRYRCIEGFSTGRKSRLDPATVLVCFGNGRGRRGCALPFAVHRGIALRDGVGGSRFQYRGLAAS
jgi:hypothetical protein